MIKLISKFDFVKCSRSFNDILQMYWPFLSKIVFELEKPEPILRSREEDPNEGSDHHTSYINEREPSIVDDMKAWDSANEHMFCVLRLDNNRGSVKCIAAI